MLDTCTVMGKVVATAPINPTKPAAINTPTAPPNKDSAIASIKNCSTMVYVIDAQEEEYEEALPKLVETISVAHSFNPAIHFEVFLHKVDGDFMSEEAKAERQQVRQTYFYFLSSCVMERWVHITFTMF